ncbi:MAG: GWxTD domain-containing protein [Holophagales bacterium]|nr:GWxTD domain-containing protein [Holophagales bacterium]
MRKLRLLATLVPLVALAFPAAAQLEKFKDWDKSPEFTYYATEDEQAAWKAVKSDEEAQKFYNLFWGKRHPDYQKTAQNVFRARFDALAAKADELFPLGKPGEKRFRRGALTERGKVLILLGPPHAMGSKVTTSATAGAGLGAEEGEGRVLAAGGAGTAVLTRFQYEKEQLPEWSGLKTLLLNFTTDQTTLSESVDKPADVKKIQKKAIAAALVNPKMTEPPVYKTREEHEAEQRAAAAAAEAAKGPVLSAPVREKLEALIGKEPQGDLGVFPLAFGDKATRLMVQLGVPAAAVAAPAAAVAADPAAAAAAPAQAATPAMKVALLVRGKDGKDAARREEAAVLQKSKGDFFVDYSLPVEPGDYEVAMALLDETGAEKVSAHRTVNVPALPSELGVSQLLLAYNDVPFEGAKGDEPLVFSARKFVVRGDNRFQKTDGLAYVARLYNPAVDPATRKLNLQRSISIKPKNGSTIDVPQPPDEPMAVPEQAGMSTALVLDLAGAIVDVNIGEYFRPGEYTLILKLTDVVAGKSVEVKTPFTLVAPPAPAAKAPAAKAPATKK